MIDGPTSLIWVTTLLYTLRQFNNTRFEWVAFLALPLVVLGGLVHWRALRGRFKPYLHRALYAHGYELCPQCAYWLRGLADDASHCPECGAERSHATAVRP